MPIFSIRAEYQVDSREKGSRFIGIMFPVWEEDDFEERLSALRKTYYDATHLCSAVIRYGNPNLEQAHDDGEPSGTAGLPILYALKSAGLVNVGLIVIRYFGGTKLGKPGLIAAYGDTARMCIASAECIEVQVAETYQIRTRYDQWKTLDTLLSRLRIQRVAATYEHTITQTVRVDTDQSKLLREQLEKLRYTGLEYELLSGGLVFVS
jgi:uncharacterized YigZ family protein